MVKPPRVRHSKSEREPATIDLDPSDVSRVTPDDATADATANADERAEPAVSEPVTAEPASETAGESAPPDAFAAAEPQSDLPFDPAPADANIEAQAEMAEAASPAAGTTASAFGRDAGSSRRSDTPADPTRAAPPPPPPRRGGSGLLAGLIGGVAALAIAWALQSAGVLPGAGAPPPADNSEAITGLQSEITAMKTEIARLKEQPEPAGVAELRTALGEQGTRMDTLTQGIDAVKGDLATLRQAVESGGAGDGAAVAALETRIRDIEASIAALGQGNGQPDAAALEALGTRIATLESAIKSAAAAANATDSRITGVEQSLAALAQKVESLGGQPKVALAIAAAALRAALDRGGTFVAEVETFAAVAPNSPDLQALREIAAKGVATRIQIAAEMGDAANQMIAAGQVADPDAGFFDSLWDGIASLVTVRPIGEVEGAGVPETVARMEVAIKQGDLVKALAEYDTLPEAVKAAGAVFGDKVRTRLAAEQLVEKALADALKAA
jgi:hypothetical protein